MQERYQGQCIRRVREEGKIGDELVLGADLKVVTGLRLSVAYGILLHSQSCWMFDNDLQQMVSVVIESESGSVYDFSSPGVIELDFDVVRSYNGYLTGG